MYTDKENLTVLETAIYLSIDIKKVVTRIKEGRMKSFVQNDVIYIPIEEVRSFQMYLNSSF